MNSIQYEELCRLFIADKFELLIEEIQSVRIPNPKRPDLPEYKHQIDLYWEDGNELTENKYIANAKWRSSDKIDQPDVLLLQKVKEKVAANKAVMITSIGFTEGAEAAARDEGIALHIVRPNFDHATLDLRLKDRRTIQTQFQKFSTDGKPPYTYNVVHRAFGLGKDTAQSGSVSKTDPRSKEIVRSPSNRIAQPTSHQRIPSGTQKVQRGSIRTQTTGQSGSVQKSAGPARGGGGRSNRGR